MMKQLLLSFSPLLVFLLHCTTTLAQSPAQAPVQAIAQPPAQAIAQPPAQAIAQPPVQSIAQSPLQSIAQSPALSPALSASANVTAILEKAGHFNTLIWLLGNTKVGDQINTQISTSHQGVTLFAPTDNAFSRLKSGTLNSLSVQKTLQLVQFHVVPSFISHSQFQAVSNPLRTQAGLSDNFPLNLTTAGNQVNISTGLVNATVSHDIYADGQLGVYEVDKVLLPLDIFNAPAPAAAPAPSSPSPPSPPSDPSSSSITSVDDSSATGLIRHAAVSFAVAAIAAFSL